MVQKYEQIEREIAVAKTKMQLHRNKWNNLF